MGEIVEEYVGKLTMLPGIFGPYDPHPGVIPSGKVSGFSIGGKIGGFSVGHFPMQVWKV